MRLRRLTFGLDVTELVPFKKTVPVLLKGCGGYVRLNFVCDGSMPAMSVALNLEGYSRRGRMLSTHGVAVLSGVFEVERASKKRAKRHPEEPGHLSLVTQKLHSRLFESVLSSSPSTTTGPCLTPWGSATSSESTPSGQFWVSIWKNIGRVE